MSESNDIVAQNNEHLKNEIQTFILGGELSRKLTSTQKDLCINTALAFRLNPLKREVHFVPYNNDVKIVVGYEVYLKRAENSRKLNGWKVDIDGAGANMKAIVTIWRKDWEKPFEHEVWFQEVRQSSPIWLKMPRFMLKKVAIAQAFRLAFPEELGGLPYMPEEIGLEVRERQEPTTPTQQFTEAEASTVETGTLEPVEDVTPTCSNCKVTISDKVKSYSNRIYKRTLCMTCQKKAGAR